MKILNMIKKHMHLTVFGVTDSSSNFDWRNAIIDAFIMSMITFFTRLATTTTPEFTALYNASIQALLSFFVFLGIKRGIVKRTDEGVKPTE